MLRRREKIIGMLIASIATIFVFGLQAEAKSKMQKQSFGKTADGQQVDLYILTNKNGMEAAITNYGATVVSLMVPDRNGKRDDVVLGYDTARRLRDRQSLHRRDRRTLCEPNRARHLHP